MTNYSALLTPEDLEFVCSLIPVRAFKDCYTQNIQEFQRIRKVRPQKMSDKETRSFAVSNVKAGFIAHFLNRGIGMWLKEIDEHKASLLAEGKDATEALVQTLSMCVFSDRIEVYFKLIQDMPSQEYLTLLQFAISKYQVGDTPQEPAKSGDDEDKLASMQAELDSRLEAQRSQHVQEIADLQKENAAMVSAIKQESEASLLAAEQAKSELEQVNEALAAAETKLADYEKHADLDLEDDSYSPSAGYSFISLCQNYSDHLGRSRLRRLADIDESGNIVQGFLESYPIYERLFRNDGPSTDGTIAIWDWIVLPSQSDPTRPHFQTVFDDRYAPTVVYIATDCLDSSDLLAHLKSGIELPSWFSRALCVFYNGAAYEGILLHSHMLTQNVGKYRLKDSVFKLRVFEIRATDILHFENVEIGILGRVRLGVPTRIIQVRDSMEIVRNAILKRSSWAILKQLDFTHAQYQQVKEFLTDLPQTSLYEEIVAECDCDLEEAYDLVHRFIDNAEDVLAGHTISSSILSQAIRNNSNMYRRCLEDLRAEWEAQNQESLDVANAALEQIKEQEQRSQESLRESEQQHQALKQQIDAFTAKINAQDQLAADVEARVLERIERARKQAADFIAENAFMNPALTPAAPQAPTQVNQGEEENNGAYIPGEHLENDDVEICKDWSRLLKTVQEELCCAGVADKVAPGLSACLYSAYLHRVPILLAGPFGVEIAKAFSLALNAHTPDIIQCSESSASAAFSRYEESDAKVAVLVDLFHRESYARVLQLVEQSGKFCIAIHPYIEDLVIEPNGFTNYFIPIFTDQMIGNRPRGGYIGGRASDDFKAYPTVEPHEHHRRLLGKLPLSMLTKNTIQQIMTDMREMLTNYRPDFDYLYILYPLAYITGNLHELLDYMEEVQGDNKPSTSAIEQVKQLAGEDE